MVDDAAVHLLGHGGIEAAIARLHMENRHAAAARRDGGERAVGIPQDQHCIGLMIDQGAVGARDDIGDRFGGGIGGHVQMQIGRAHAQFVEEDLAQARIMVLAGVDQRVAIMAVERGDDAREADDLGAGAENRHHVERHRPSRATASSTLSI